MGYLFSVKADMDSLNAVYSDSLRAVAEGECDGIIKEAVQGAVRSHLLHSAETARTGRMARNISLLARSSLLCATTNGKLLGKLPSLSDYVGDDYQQGLASHSRLVGDASEWSYEDIISRFTNPKQSPMQQPSKQKAEKRICKHKGCNTPVHSEAYEAGYCKKHNPSPKVCNACQKIDRKRLGVFAHLVIQNRILKRIMLLHCV